MTIITAPRKNLGAVIMLLLLILTKKICAIYLKLSIIISVFYANY